MVEEIAIDILKKIQTDISVIKTDIRELKVGQGILREQFHTLEGNFLRRERMMAMLELRVERIENRLDLRDS